jgi:phosphoglycolate phosphatase
MELKRPKAILFDWDNTLVNTWPVIHEALHKTFTQMGREPWTIDMVKQRVARSMRDSFPMVFGENWQEAGEIYQQYFREVHLQRLQALPGAEATLALLKKHPVYVAVVSNKKGINLRAEVEHIGWSPYFQKVVGADDTPFDKPLPDPVHAALKGSNIEAGADVWFIGDSAVDMECAAATGCIPIWYGEPPAEPLKHPVKQSAISHEQLQKILDLVF